MERSPCDDCAYRQHCKDHSEACPEYVLFYRGFGWGRKHREPTRVDFHRAFNDLNIQSAFGVIADVIRQARADGRKPTIGEMAKRLGYDRKAAVELVVRYKAKQGMTGDVFGADCQST